MASTRPTASASVPASTRTQAAGTSAGQRPVTTGSRAQRTTTPRGRGLRGRQPLRRPHLPSPARPQGVTQHDILKYGPQAAAWLGTLTHKQRQQLIAQAKKGGWTLPGMMPQRDGSLLAPGLRPLSISGMARTAQSMTDAAYRPALDALDQRQARVMALDKKRQDDHAYYQEWLRQQLDDLDMKARAADATLLQAQGSVANDIGQAAAAATDAQSQTGYTGQFAGTPQDQSVKTADAAAKLSITNQTGQNVNALAGGEARRQGYRAEVLANGAAQEGIRLGKTQEALAQVDSDRATTLSQRGQAYAQTLQGIRDTESNKASDVADRNLTAEELNLKRADLNIKKSQDAQEYKKWRSEFIANYHVSPERYARMSMQQKLRLEKKWKRAGLAPPTTPDWKQDWNGDGKIDLKDKQLWTDAGTPTSDKDNGNGKNGKNGKNGPTDGQRGADRAAYRAVTNAMGFLGDFRDTFGNGRDHKGRDARQHVIAKTGSDNSVVQLAQIIRSHGGKINARGVAIAKALGIMHPERYWPLTDAATVAPHTRPVTGRPPRPGSLPQVTTHMPGSRN